MGARILDLGFYLGFCQNAPDFVRPFGYCEAILESDPQKPALLANQQQNHSLAQVEYA